MTPYIIHRWMCPGLRMHGLRQRVDAYRLLFCDQGQRVNVTIRGEWPSFGVATRWQSVPVTRLGKKSIGVELANGKRVSLPLLDGDCGFTEIELAAIESEDA